MEGFFSGFRMAIFVVMELSRIVVEILVLFFLILSAVVKHTGSLFAALPFLIGLGGLIFVGWLPCHFWANAQVAQGIFLDKPGE